MKIRIQFKDPDASYDAVNEAVSDELESLNLDADEHEALHALRAEKVRAAIGRWLKHGEYIAIDFDTDAMTATVVESKP